MRTLAFFAVAGLVLVALLFVADATLQNVSPIVTSDRYGLPKSWHPDRVQTLTSTPAPAPDMTSQAVLGAQPKSASEALSRIDSAARGAQEPLPNSHVSPFDYQGRRSVDRLSIGNQ